MILEWAGKDASKEFESIGHSSDASRALKGCRIGMVGQTALGERKSQLIEDQVPVQKTGKRKRRPLLLFCA